MKTARINKIGAAAATRWAQWRWVDGPPAKAQLAYLAYEARPARVPTRSKTEGKTQCLSFSFSTKKKHSNPRRKHYQKNILHRSIKKMENKKKKKI